MLCVQIADLLGVSLELGCFLAGLTIGAKGHGIVDRVSWHVGGEGEGRGGEGRGRGGGGERRMTLVCS